MTDAQRDRLERRMLTLLSSGARVDRGQHSSTAKDEELCRVVAVLTRGRRQPAATKTATRKPAAARKVRVAHATSPITGRSMTATPLFNVSDIGGYYRRGA